jgi:hypothetical protein
MGEIIAWRLIFGMLFIIFVLIIIISKIED